MLISLSEICQEGWVKKPLGGCLGFLSIDLEDKVILNVMDDLILSKERYPESFMLISLLEAWQEVVVLHWCTWMTLMVSRLEDRVLPDAMNDLIFPKEVTTKVSC